MKSLLQIILALITLLSCNSLHAQLVPSIEWQKSLGGSDHDYCWSVQQTTDGGFIVAGDAESTDGDVPDNCNGHYWIVKLDMAGNIDWQKCFGGSGGERPNSIQQTTDDGFIVAGYSYSNDGDVSGHHDSNFPNTDYWIVKLDSAGNLVWQKSLGGSDHDRANSVQQTIDGGFIVAGYSQSNDGDVSGNHGGQSPYDYWVVKLDSIGNLIWQKSLGGSGTEIASSIAEITDGGFIVAGYSTANGGDVSGHHGSVFYTDAWIVKLDTDGNLTWQKSLGGSDQDDALSVKPTSDGGIIIAGYAESNDGDVTDSHGNGDYWIVKLDMAGNIVWQKCLGGSVGDLPYSIQQTTDGGFIVAGFSDSNDGDVSGFHGGYGDYWIVKLDSIGNLVWQKCLGGSSVEEANSIQQTTDGGYVVVGRSASVDGDVLGNHGGLDWWIVKLTSGQSGIASLSHDFTSIFPNPVQTQLAINLATPSNELSIRVYDLQGTMIALPTTFTNTQAQLNTTALPDGFYTLQIINKKTGKNEVGKFVKGS